MMVGRWGALGRGAIALCVLVLGACAANNANDTDTTTNPTQGLEVKLRVGSALGKFCDEAATQFNQQQPKLDDGTAFFMRCEAMGSGDVVTSLLNQAQQFKAGSLPADSPEFPTLLSVDGEIYQSQLVYQMNQLFPGQNYVPDITESPLLASSPMVFMVPAELADGLQKLDQPFKALVDAKTHQDLDAQGPPLTVHFVQTAPTRSNSGLQTLVAQFVAVSGKRPEDLTIADVKQYQDAVQKIQQKVTRYGVSTSSLAKAMVQNGPFWATVGSVYESSVIAANTQQQPDQTRYQAVYPKVTFSSNMRAILPNAPWVSDAEKAAATQIIEYLRSPAAQEIAVRHGLRPGVPGVPLGPLFSAENGVQPNPQYDSLRPPKPEVVAAMLQSWEQFAKKPSLVVIVVDSSGSMRGNKLPAVQQTLQTYLNNLGPNDKIALIDFDSDIRPPVLVDGTPAGRDRGLQFISGLQAQGGTKLYDATLVARDWLRQNLRPNAINAVLVLTDGHDSGSKISLDNLGAELKKTGFGSDERIAFFTVGYGREGEFDPAALQQIANLNGGYYSKGDPDTIAKLMADLQLEF